MKKRFLSLIVMFGVLAQLMPCAVQAATWGDLSYTVSNGEATIIYCSNSVTSLEIPSVIEGYPVTGIKSEAFDGRTNLTDVSIENGIITIGDHAFYGCSNLKNINIPNSVITIGDHAFYGCSSLATVSIPSSVTRVGARAFNNTAYYNDSDNWVNGMLYVGDCLIETNQSLSGKYAVKDETRVIADHAFFGCRKLTGIIVPGGVTSINEDAFSGCSSLKNVYIYNPKAEFANQNIFGECEGVTIYGYENSTAESYALKYSIDFICLEDQYSLFGKATAVSGHIIVDVITKQITDATLHTAIYSEDGEMLDYMIVPHFGMFTRITPVFKDIPGASYARIFLWTDMSRMEPLADAVTLQIEKE